MRLLELILVLATVALAACSPRLAAAGRSTGLQWIHGLQWLLLAVLVAQVLVEGWRWQMLPAYAATLLIAAAPNLFGPGASALFWSGSAGIALLALSLLSCLLLPFVEPRLPHGPFAVAVATLPVIVPRQPDVGPDELKAVPLVRIWYPAQPAHKWPQLKSRIDERISDRLRAVAKLPALSDAPVAQSAAKFPVVIYFDGWPEDKIQNVQLILELASRGFAVASVEYPGLIDRPMVEYSSEVAFNHSVHLVHTRARIHARDAIAVLEKLSALDSAGDSRFAHRLDTSRAATLGFSFGGAVAAEASRLDTRIKAVINMDGRHWGDSLDQGVARPYMFICEELAMPTAADLASANPEIRYEAQLDQVDYSQLAANLRARGGVRVTIADMAHMNFTDVPLRSPLRRLSGGGHIDARRAQQIIQTYVIEFFARYLQSGHPPALDSPWPQLPQVRVESWPAAKAAP